MTDYVSLSNMYSNWSQVEAHAATWKQHKTLAEVFLEDSKRAARYSVSAAGLELDYSKNHIDDTTLTLLGKICEEADLKQAIKNLFRGVNVNNTEERPALHMALRHIGRAESKEHEAVEETLKKMASLVENIQSGTWKGHSGKAITDVVNIGIGGSDLGPRMVVKALTPYHAPNLKVHFAANIDGSEIYDLQQSLNPETTLWLVASKSFSTLETLQNALNARRWMLESGCSENDLDKHFVAISSKIDKAVEFGIAEENVLPMWDWVGGRYSLWSAIGLPIALAVGMENFNRLRAGAAEMDAHFEEAPLDNNIPVLMALLVFWYSSGLGSNNQAVLPYSNHLQLLPSYLQQLEMESNGKSVTKDGEKLGYQTGSIVWGTEGTNGQHSFHQLLHQGTIFTPIDFIAPLKAQHPYQHQQKHLFSNCVAQSQALMQGRDFNASLNDLAANGLTGPEAELLAQHKVHPGNNPSNTILMDELTPETLGALIAAYEHKVYVLGVLWNINSFDQWGVELGKLLGTQVATAIDTTDVPKDWDSSTQKLIRRYLETNA